MYKNITNISNFADTDNELTIDPINQTYILGTTRLKPAFNLTNKVLITLAPTSPYF